MSRCDDPDCECHWPFDANDRITEIAYAQHCELPGECLPGCPWCLAEEEEWQEAQKNRGVFNRIFGGW